MTSATSTATTSVQQSFRGMSIPSSADVFERKSSFTVSLVQGTTPAASASEIVSPTPSSEDLSTTNVLEEDVVWLRLLTTSSLGGSTECSSSNGTSTGGNLTTNCTSLASSASSNATSAAAITTSSPVNTTAAATTTLSPTSVSPVVAATSSSSDDELFSGLFFYLFASLAGAIVLCFLICMCYSCATGYCSALYQWHSHWIAGTLPPSMAPPGAGANGRVAPDHDRHDPSKPVEQQSIKSGDEFNFEDFFFSGGAEDEKAPPRGSSRSNNRGGSVVPNGRPPGGADSRSEGSFSDADDT
ncbi:unnamed protein product [Amoebophrya sp. A25]|nr:unnamed protein product [Amoebophrya sp. A25]|eukprot:GSA25T00013724001.1